MMVIWRSYPVDEVVTAVATVVTEVVGSSVTPCRVGWRTTGEDRSCCWSCAASNSCWRCSGASLIPPNWDSMSCEVFAVVVDSFSDVCVPLPDSTWIWTPRLELLCWLASCCWGVTGGELDSCGVTELPLPLLVVWTLLFIMPQQEVERVFYLYTAMERRVGEEMGKGEKEENRNRLLSFILLHDLHTYIKWLVNTISGYQSWS